MPTPTAEPVPVRFWVDPSCPFTWMASRWIHEVADRRPLQLTWEVMSLVVLNETPELPEAWRQRAPANWRGTRLAAAVAERHGSDALGRLYTALGTRLHPGGRSIDVDVVVESLSEVGLPAALVDVIDDPAWDDAVRASHARSQAAVGDTVGGPVVAIGGHAFFGPVVTPIPRGADALQLFDALRALVAVPQFAELKRGRNGPPDFS